MKILYNVELFDSGAMHHPGYHAVLKHLYQRLDLEKLDPSTFLTVNRDLDDYRNFLGTIGNPHLQRKTIHVTGTRGKGSFVAALEAILLAAGYRTGATVSPHLEEVRERIRIDGEDLSRQEFADFYHQIMPAIEARLGESNYRTVFEIITALAFHVFAKKEVDAALVEVGLGGKLDATNVVEPVLAAITHIGLDHTKILGETTGEIAADKAQIIKQKVPVVIALQPSDAREAIEKRARLMSSRLWRLGKEAILSNIRVDESGTTFDLTTPYRSYLNIKTSLLGAHQAENTAVAVMAADRLTADGIFKITSEAVQAGLQNVRWYGRGEILRRHPIVLLDGAHTPQGAAALNDLLEKCWKETPRIMILGFNRDKDVPGFLKCFPKSPKQVIATAASSPRAMTPEEVAEEVRNHGWDARPYAVNEALSRALSLSNPEDMIIITGSLYLVGTLRSIFRESSGLHLLNEMTSSESIDSNVEIQS